MSPGVMVIHEGAGGFWRIRDARAGTLLFGGVSFNARREALTFIENANRKVGSRKWTVKTSKKVKDDRQLSLFDLF